MSADLKFYYQLMMRRLPVMTVIFTLCAGLGVALAMTLPPKYKADAKLLVESGPISERTGNRNDPFDTEANKKLQVIQQRLLTRANLVDIANKYRVFAGDDDLEPDDIVDRMREQTRIKLLSGRNRATFMEISFVSKRAKTSADVVNEFVTLVLAEDAEIRADGSRQKLAFRVQQVERLDKELTRQSAEIVAFKEANKDALPEGLEYRLDRQATLQERLNLNARDRAALEEQRTRLEALGSEQVPVAVQLTPEELQLAQFKAQLAEWDAVLAGTNPKVKVLRAKIAELEKRINEQDTPTPSNPASMLEVSLAEIDSRIKFIEEDMRGTEVEIQVLREAIEATPKVAIRLDELEREYQNTQMLYNQAVADRAAAQTGEQIEVNAVGDRVSVIEQAIVPSSPTSPNRKLIAGGGVFMGSALAGIFFVLTELLNRTIRRPIDLTRALNVQPLATIPYLEEESVRRRRRALKTILVVGILIAIPIGLWALHTFYLPLDLMIEMVLDRVGL